MKCPSISTYRYGEARRRGEGLRIGAAHYVPRGVKRTDWAVKGYFDQWLPILSPDAGMVSDFRKGRITFSQFARAYRKRMGGKEQTQVIALLGAIAWRTSISLGCYCEDESQCHRSILQELILKAAQDHQPARNAQKEAPESIRYASPVCYADWEDE